MLGSACMQGGAGPRGSQEDKQHGSAGAALERSREATSGAWCPVSYAGRWLTQQAFVLDSHQRFVTLCCNVWVEMHWDDSANTPRTLSLYFLQLLRPQWDMFLSGKLSMQVVKILRRRLTRKEKWARSSWPAPLQIMAPKVCDPAF